MMDSTLLPVIDLFLPVNDLHRSLVPETHGFDQQLMPGAASRSLSKAMFRLTMWQ